MRPTNPQTRVLCICLLFMASATAIAAHSTKSSLSSTAYVHHSGKSSTAGINEDPVSLPVNFGAMSAMLRDNQLIVKWETIYEKGNTHFELELSTDGVTFAKFADVKSKAQDGSSDVHLQYEHQVSQPMESLVLGTSLLLVLLSGAFYKKRKALVWIVLVMAGSAIYSCSKQQLVEIKEDDKKLFIRVTQVDKDGLKSSSKCVQAIRK